MAKKAKEVNEELEGQVAINEVGEVIEPIKVEELTEDEKKIRFLAKKRELRIFLMQFNFIKDGYNQQLSNEYVKAEQFRNALSRGCLEVRMEYTATSVNTIFENIAKSDKMYLTTLVEDITLIDIDTGYSMTTRVFSTGADNLDKGLPKAYSMLWKNYLQSEFGLLAGSNDDAEADIIEPKKTNFVTPAKKEEIAKEVVSKEQAAGGELTTPEFLTAMGNILSKIREVEPTYGDKTVNIIDTALSTGVMPSQADMVRRMSILEKKFEDMNK